MGWPKIIALLTCLCLAAGCATVRPSWVREETLKEYHACLASYEQRSYESCLARGKKLVGKMQDTTVVPPSQRYSYLDGASNETHARDEDGAVVQGFCVLLFVALPSSWLYAAGDAADAVTLGGRLQEVDNPKHRTIDWMLSKREQRDLFKAMGLSAWELGRSADAALYLRSYIDIQDEFRLTIGREDQRQGYVGTYYRDLGLLIRALYQSGQYALAVTYAEFAKAKTTSEALMSSSLARTDKKTLTTLLIAQKQKEIIEEKPKLTPKDAELARRSIAALGGGERSTARRSLVLARHITTAPLPLGDLANLPGDPALLSYYQGEGFLFSAAVHKGKVISHSLRPGDAGQLAARVGRYNTAARGNRPAEFGPASAALFDLLLQPHMGALRDCGAKVLVISPHASLQGLSFAGLGRGDYLVQRFAPAYVFSFNFLSQLESMKSPNTWPPDQAAALVVGNPENRGHPAPALTMAETEARQVSDCLKKCGWATRVELLCGREAGERLVKNRMSQADLVHLATHSCFDLRDGDNSFIYLGDTQGEDGKLSVHEIYAIRRDKPMELVVLSSCESGAAELRPGNDPHGLSRGLFILGAKRILSTYWPIEDSYAFDMMLLFYENAVTRGENPALALQSACRQMMAGAPDHKGGRGVRVQGDRRASEQSLEWLAFKLEGVPW